VDVAGYFYIAHNDAFVIRKGAASGGIVTTVVGIFSAEEADNGGNGPAANAGIWPYGVVAVPSAGVSTT
jgi:hypothetical protein